MGSDGVERPDDNDRRRRAFLHAAAEYIFETRGHDTFSRRDGTLDQRLAFSICEFLAHYVSPGRSTTSAEREQFERLRRIFGTPPRNLDAAYYAGVQIVQEYGAALAREDQPIGLLVPSFVVALQWSVDLKFGAWLMTAAALPPTVALPKERAPKRTSASEFALGVLRQFDPNPKGKRGRVGAAGALALLLREVEALGHTKKRPLANVRKAVEEGVIRERDRRRQSGQ